MNNIIKEASPEGWRGTVRAMLTHHPELNKGEDKNPWALAHWMQNKGYEPHYKNQKSSLKGEPHKKRKYKDEETEHKKTTAEKEGQVDEDRMQKTTGLSTWKNWLALKESNTACQCSCQDCKNGNCKNCSCNDCSCQNCRCS